MILAQWDARGAAHTSPKSRHPHTPRPPAPVAATSPERPRWVIAKPEVVGTGFRPSDITKGIMGDDPMAMASTAVGVVGLKVAITAHRRSRTAYGRHVDGPVAHLRPWVGEDESYGTDR